MVRLFDTPIINQPQVGILGTGAVVKRAVVVDDAELGEIVAPRSMMYLALSYDHRLVDGADAARFLTTIKDRFGGGRVRERILTSAILGKRACFDLVPRAFDQDRDAGERGARACG